MIEIANAEGVDRSELTLFYYEVFEEQYDPPTKQWSRFQPEESFATDVEKPTTARLEGFDVVSFSVGTSPECSPLSCNSMADEIEVNEHCLFAEMEAAKSALEDGKFDDAEPGPYRIFAVYTL
jgi:hypothetical protein